MKDLVVNILKIVAPLSVALIVLSEGLGIAPRQVLDYFNKRTGLIARALVAALVLVPAAALALILLLKPSPAVGIALAILVACPPAPLMVSTASRQGASAAFIASLHLCLAACAFVTVPTILYLLAIPLGFKAVVGTGMMAWVLSRTILIPLVLGMAIRKLFPDSADTLARVLGRAGNIALIVVVGFVLIALYPALLAMDRWSYLVIAAVSVAALTIGEVLGPPDPHERTALAVECGARHPALAITIGGASIGPERALPALVPCVITFIVIAWVYLSLRRRSLGSDGEARMS